jgi:hypothetical protein
MVNLNDVHVISPRTIQESLTPQTRVLHFQHLILYIWYLEPDYNDVLQILQSSPLIFKN